MFLRLPFSRSHEIYLSHTTNSLLFAMRQPTPIYWVVQVCLLCLTILSPFGFASAISPRIESSLSVRDDSSSGSQYDEKFVLRILPVGASITLGYKSTDGNGYRDWIRRQLRWEGWQVEMIGSKRFGTMRDNVSFSSRNNKCSSPEVAG